MSVHVMSWVLRHSEAKLGQRLVMLVLADHAKDDGTSSWPSVETIGREARLSKRQVQRCLAELQGDGRIVATGKSKAGTTVYNVVLDEDLPIDVEARGDDKTSPVSSAPGGVTSTTPKRDRMSPEPSLEPPEEPSPPVRAREVARIGARPLVGEKAWKVDKRPVTFDEDRLARAVLAEWNQQTGQNLQSRDWLAKIVMRIREQYGLSIVDYGRVIRAALADPWWKGPPSPSVVFGNGAQFERSLVHADETPGARTVPMRRRYGRGMTTREILERTGS